MNSQKDQGFVRLIILILVVLIALSYLGFDVKKIVYSPVITKIAGGVWQIVLLLWRLLYTIIAGSWDTITKGLEYLIHFAQNIKTT